MVGGSDPDAPEWALPDSAPADSAQADLAPCTVLHVDMDSFFASVEVLDDPSLAGRPVIVGGEGRRGVVASCTYEARSYGIHSAMPSMEARQRCPHAVFVSGRYARYAEMSERLHDILRRFSPVIEGVGLDEAFIDVSGARRAVGEPVAVAHAIRRAVRDELGLECAVGVARTKLIAKLASRAAKPVASPEGPRPGRGVVAVVPSEELAFLHPLPVRALWGVGPATAARLENLGVSTVEELATVPEDALRRAVGDAHGQLLAALARAEDPRVVEASREAKSVGHEETFSTDLHSHGELHTRVVRMADAVARRLQEASLSGRTVTIKVRYGDFATITRSHTLPSALDSPRALAALAEALLDTVEVGPGVRLLGVSVSSLENAGEHARQLSFDQLSIDRPSVHPLSVEGAAAGERVHDGRVAVDEGRSGDEEEEVRRPRARGTAWDEVEAAVSAIRGRYGHASIGPAALVSDKGLSVKRRGDTQWGPSDVPHEER